MLGRPPMLGAPGAIGGGAVPVVMGARRWWTADSGHDRSSTIASWRDVLAGAELTAAGAARPSYDATGCGGRPAVAFDGASEVMTIAGSSALDLGTGATIYSVLESASAASDACAWARWSSTASECLWALSLHGGGATSTGASSVSETGTNTTRFSTLAGTVGSAQDPSSGAGNARGIMLHWDGATVTHYTGRVAGAGAACAGAKTRDATDLQVGRLYSGVGAAIQQIRHLLIFPRALTSAERTALWDWAAADCGVP